MPSEVSPKKRNWFRRLIRFQISITGMLVLMTVAAFATPMVYKWAVDCADRVKVSSTTIQSIGYNRYTGTMEIEFTNGTIYQYFKVPAELHRKFMSAKSLGSYFHNHVRNAGFKFEKIQ